MKILIYIIIFIVSFCFQALVTKIMNNYWFPSETYIWLYRISLTFILTTFAYSNYKKNNL